MSNADLPPMDRWQSLRDRLDAGPRDDDTVYRTADGQTGFWTLGEVRADYLQALLDERDQLADVLTGDMDDDTDASGVKASDVLRRAADMLDTFDQLARTIAARMGRPNPISGPGMQQDLAAIAGQLDNLPAVDRTLGKHARWLADHTTGS